MTEDTEKMEGPLSLEKCRKALDTFESDKTPGEDGFTVKFYKTFFDLIGQDLAASFNAAYEVNELSTSQRRGVVTLIPKEDGSLLELQNGTPITLLNVDSKISTKVIAKRILDAFNFGTSIKRRVGLALFIQISKAQS